MSHKFGHVLAAATLAVVALTPMPAQAAQLQCGAVVTEDTVLGSDLVCSSGPALTVAADGVTVDLDGHRIDVSTYDGGGDGIIVAAAADVTITGGEITSYEAAIRVEHDVVGLEVSAMTISGYYGIQTLGDMDSSRVSGVAFGGTWLPLYGLSGSDNVITGSSANGGDAIFAIHGDRNRITRNHLANSNTTNLTVVGDRNLVLDNVSETGMSGFFVSGDRNVIRGNRIGPTSGEGLYVAGDRNLVARNDLIGGWSGMRVSGARATLVQNSARGTSGDGIRIDGTGATVSGNQAYDNEGYGIRSQLPASGGGNIASGNQAGQCLNVSCRTRSGRR